MLANWLSCRRFFFLIIRSWCTAEREDQQETLDFMNSKLEDVTEQIKNKIQNITLF